LRPQVVDYLELLATEYGGVGRGHFVGVEEGFLAPHGEALGVVLAEAPPVFAAFPLQRYDYFLISRAISPKKYKKNAATQVSAQMMRWGEWSRVMV